MDVETSEAIERLGERIDALEVPFRTEFREGLREGLAENRRHTEVLFESLRDDIRIVADGFAAVSAKLDALRAVGGLLAIVRDDESSHADSRFL